MVNDIIEELLNLDMEPSGNHYGGRVRTRRRASSRSRWEEGRGKDWELPFREVFEVLVCRFQRDGKGTQGVEKTLRKGMGSWWRDAKINLSKSVSLATKCQRVISHVFSTALNSSVNWTWNVCYARMVHRWETKILRLTFSPKMQPGEEWVALQSTHCPYAANQVEENWSAIIGRIVC